MKKTYWWRVGTLSMSIMGIIVGYLTFYPYKYNLCDIELGNCIFSSWKKTISEPLFILAIFLSIISLSLFFTSDNIFKKWLKFAAGWIFISLIAIASTPEYPGGFLDPNREQVSIWMSSLFLIISIILIVVWSIRERNKK